MSERGSGTAAPARRAARRAAALLAAAALASAKPGPAWAAEAVDLALVLAVDSSSSVDFREFDLQMRGLADAFRDPAVHDAIRAAAPRGVAVTLVLWSGQKDQATALDWRRVTDAGTAEAVAGALDRTPRFFPGGTTAIGDALDYALGVMAESPYAAARRAIDLSGDGTANRGVPPGAARDRAVEAGVTVNALAILNEEPDLESYYLRYVVGGRDAFVMAADDYEDFARAIRRKLIREIEGGFIALRPKAFGRRAAARPRRTDPG